MVWDADNRLSSVTAAGGTSVMAYDYTGIRVTKNAPSGITTFPFSGYEIDPGGTITKYIKIGNEIVGASKGGEKLFYHNDHLGGVNVITDIWTARVQLVEYDPWGKVSREEGIGDSLRRFTGKILDPESGLYYYGGRYYDPDLGRFISPDPFVGQPGDPQNLNRYSYVENNPVNNVDPSGYFLKKLFKKIGQALKNLFKKPGVFFATLGVGLVTGGLAWAAAPALGITTLTAKLAFAGALGGAAAGAAGAGMTGGNIWQGALLGFAGGAVGGAVAGSMGGGIGGYLAGAFAAGAAAGGMSTAFYGGNFFENMLVGGTASFAVASGFALARFAYEQVVGYPPDWKRPGDAVPRGPEDPPVPGRSSVGFATEHPGESPLSEGSSLMRTLDRFPGIDPFSKLHDLIVPPRTASPFLGHPLGPINFSTMAPALAITYGALVATGPPHAYSIPYKRHERFD